VQSLAACYYSSKMPAKVQLEIAARVPLGLIKRLYKLDAIGILDEELVDDVASRLRQRCESFLMACRAVAGRATCPACATEIRHNGRREYQLACRCGWKAAWGDYFDAIRRRQLSGAEPVQRLFSEFLVGLQSARDARAKMLLIDRLIHGYHLYLNNVDHPTRPVAVNLLHGSLAEVLSCLDGLAQSSMSSAGVEQTHQAWRLRSKKAKRNLGME